MSLVAAGFLKKLIDKLDVTAKATKPSSPSTAAYNATSATVIVNWGVAASEKEVAFDTHQNNAAGDAPSHKSLSKNASPVVSGLEGVSSG